MAAAASQSGRFQCTVSDVVARSDGDEQRASASKNRRSTTSRPLLVQLGSEISDRAV